MHEVDVREAAVVDAAAAVLLEIVVVGVAGVNVRVDDGAVPPLVIGIGREKRGGIGGIAVPRAEIEVHVEGTDPERTDLVDGTVRPRCLLHRHLLLIVPGSHPETDHARLGAMIVVTQQNAACRSVDEKRVERSVAPHMEVIGEREAFFQWQNNELDGAHCESVRLARRKRPREGRVRIERRGGVDTDLVFVAVAEELPGNRKLRGRFWRGTHFAKPAATTPRTSATRM